jgi:two-component system nitrogen regulation response regulator NtrX
MAGRILVLDDEENYAEMLQDLLREQNYQVDMATRAERAIDQLEQVPYDLVISDYKMPVMDGADFLKKARELYPNLPFILVSGLMNTPELVKVANMSVTLVMEKPLDTTAFLRHVARFSTPMTSDEQAAYTRESENPDSAIEEVHGYPEEPRFFSAGSPISKRFMQDVWQICCEHSHLFILEPCGSDADLALADLSVWRGNLNQPVVQVTFEDLFAAGPGAVSELQSNSENSNVVSVRLSAPEQITQAQAHWEQELQVAAAAADLLFVYRLEGQISPSEFMQQSGAVGCVLPLLRERPTDIAVYATRFSRLATAPSDSSSRTAFVPEAAYAIMAYEWPGNYQQINEVVTAALQASEGQSLSLEALGNVLGESAVPAPEDRCASLMANAQAYHFETVLAASGDSATVLARKLELSSSVRHKDDLKHIPLINSKLATL